MATDDAKPDSTLVTEQETAGEEAHSDDSGLQLVDKLSREEKKHGESLPENPMNHQEEHTKLSNDLAVTKNDSEILHSDVDVLDETKTKTTEFSEMLSIKCDSISPDHVVSEKYDDSEEGKSGNSEEQSTAEPEENHTENLHQKPTDYAHFSLPLEQAFHEDKGAPKEEISEVQRTDDQNNIPEQAEEDMPNHDLNQNSKEESIDQEAEIGNLPPEDISPSTLTVEEHHGNAEESAKPASTKGDGSLQEFQSDAQTDEAASEDVRELLEVLIPTASEETKEDLAHITNVVPQVSEENSLDQKATEKEYDINHRDDALLRKPGNEEASVDISPNEEPQQAIKSEDIDYEKSIPGLASNDQTMKQEQGDKESIIETAEKCESGAETELQDHGKDTDSAVQAVEHHNVDQPLEDSSKEVTSMDPDSRSTEAVFETNVAEDSSAEASVNFLEEMPSAKLPNQETTQTSSEGKSEGTDTEGNIICEATDASFATSLKEELLQNEGYEPAESNISGSPRKEIAGESKADDDPLEGKSEKAKEPPIEKKTEDAETEPLSIEDQNCKSQEDIPTSQDLSEEPEIHITVEERDIEDAEDSSCDVPELELSLETCQKDEQKQEAAPNADVLQTSNQSREPETTEEDTQRLSTEVDLQDKDVNIEEAVKSSSIEEKYIPDDALVSHEDSELKVDDTSDEMDNISQTTKVNKILLDGTSDEMDNIRQTTMLEDTEQVEPNQNLTSSTDETYMDSGMVDNQNSKEEFIRDINPSNLTVEEHHGNAEESAKQASTEKDDSLNEFQSDAQTDEAVEEDCSTVTSDEVQKSVVSETVKDARELLLVSISTASEETKESKEDLAYITNVVPQVTEEYCTDQEVIEKENDIIGGDDALLRKPGKEDASQHEEPQKSIKSEDIDCEKSVSGLASNVQTTKQEQGDKESIIEMTEKCAAGETESEAEIELQDHGKDVLSDSAVQTVEHHNVDQPLDYPLEAKSEKTKEPSIEKKTEDAEITGGEHLADEQHQQEIEPLSVEDQNCKSQKDIPSPQDLTEESEIHITAEETDQIEDAEDSNRDVPELELSLETYQKDEPKQEAGPNADVLQTINQSKDPETGEDSQRLNTEVEIQDEAVKCNADEERCIPYDTLVSHVDSELKVDDTSDEMDNVIQTTKLEDTEKTIDCIPAEEGKSDDHDRNSTKESDLKSEEYSETINSESKIAKMTDSQEMTEENKFIITEEPHTVSTPEENKIYTFQEKEEKNINDIVARDVLEVRENVKPELSPIEASQITKAVCEETMNYNAVSEISEAEIYSNEDTKHVETDVTEATQSLNNQVDEEPNPGLTAEETIVQTPGEGKKEEDYVTNSTKDNGLNSQVSTGVTKDEIFETINRESPGTELEETDVIDATQKSENQTSSEDRNEEKPFQVVTAEKNINDTSPEVEVEEDYLRSEAFTGETKEETIEEPRQVLTSEEIGDYSPAKEDGINIIDTTVIDELNQKVLEPQTTYESFRREMQGGENVVEELPQLSNTEEIVYHAEERREEWTVNDATVLDDESHQEGLVNEISPAHNNSIENIKLEEGMTTEAAWILTVEVPSQDPSSNKISGQDISDKEYNERACENAAIDESTVEKNSIVHLINDTALIPSLENPVSAVQEEEPVKLSSATSARKLHEDENDSITEATFPEGESREVPNEIDNSSTNIEEKDDLAVLQDPTAVHTPIESSTPVSDVEKELERTIIHPKDGDESLQPEVEPEGEVITKEVSIIMEDSSFTESKIEENFLEQGNMSTQTRVANLNEEEKDRDQNEYQPALSIGHDSAGEAEAIEELTSEETIEEPRQVLTSEETGDYSPAKEESVNIDDTTVIDELNEKVLEPETVDDTESSTRQMQVEENVVEELPQLSNTEEIVYHAVERKDATILDNELHQENMANEISSANNKITENIKLEEGITAEIVHEERRFEVPSHDSPSYKISSQDLSDKEQNEGALNDTAIDELIIEGNLDFHQINDTSEIPSMESEATKLEEHKLNGATQSVGEKDLPAEDSPIVEKVIIYNPGVEDKEESIAKVDEINSESKSEDTTIEVESEPNLITTEGLLPGSEDREAANNVYDSNTEIKEKGVPEPQTDAIISRDTTESNLEITTVEKMEHEDASKAAVNTISKECTLNDDDKEEKVKEPVELSSPTSVRNLHEHENDSTTEATFPEGGSREVTNQIGISSTKMEEKDDLAVLQDLAAVHTPFESSTPESYVDNIKKEDPKTGTDAKIVGQEEELTIIPPKDGDESLQPEVEKNEPEGEVVTKEASIIMEDSGSKEQESEAFKISDSDQDMEITTTEDPKTDIDKKMASEDKIVSILDKSQAGEAIQSETEKLKPESTSNAVTSSTPEISFKDDQMGVNAKEQVRRLLNEDKEEYIQKNISASKVEDEMLTEGKVPEMLPEIQHGEEAKESMTSLEDLLQTSRNGNIKAAENEPTILGDDSKEGDKPYSDEDKADEDTKGEAASDSPVLVEASMDADVKVTPKKSNNILSGVGSKVKNSIAKVKKVITGKSSSPKPS